MWGIRRIAPKLKFDPLLKLTCDLSPDQSESSPSWNELPGCKNKSLILFNKFLKFILWGSVMMNIVHDFVVIFLLNLQLTKGCSCIELPLKM